LCTPAATLLPRAGRFRQLGVGKIRVNTGRKLGAVRACASCAVPFFPQPIHNHMSLDHVSPGSKVPESFNVIIEISMNGDPIKYEVDKASGCIFVDRFMNTAMHYPTNYGYVSKTIAGDGDPVDVLVITPVPLPPGVVVPCRALGILKMEDEGGVDGKVLAVPTEKILPLYSQWKSLEDLNPVRLKAIEHFFEHYKDLDPGKWVKVLGWDGKDAAHQEILDGIAAYEKDAQA
jgi:inorganic pyrophosphatase